MNINITGNSFYGDFAFEECDDSDACIIFNSNVVKGNTIISSKDILHDLSVSDCTFEERDGSIEHREISPEVMFIYQNIFIDKLDPIAILKAYDDGFVRRLRFSFDSDDQGVYKVKGVIKCLEFLKKHHNS